MTPDAFKYQITLENEQRLRMRTWQPADDAVCHDDALVRPARWSDVVISPTSRLVVWMLRRPNRRWGAVISVLLVLAYVAVVFGLWCWTPSSDITALLAMVGIAGGLWNAAKFAATGFVCIASMILPGRRLMAAE